jgi:diaminopimelate decarboxylase
MDVPTIQKITRELGTPLYLYDGDKIKAQYQLLKECLPPDFEIFYSMKANPLLGICQIFKQWGSGIEIASAGELYTAVKAGFAPEMIIFTSPGKTESELAAAVEDDIYCINIESLAEAELLNRIAADKSKTVRVALRINPDFNLSGAGIKMTGVASQFGIDQSQLETIFQKLGVLANIRVRGIHIYTGTQMLDAGQLLGNLEEIIKLALELSNRWQFKLEFLDLGGGFGIPYFPGEAALDLDLLRQGMLNIWDKYSEKLSGTRMAVESGRFLLAEAGVFLAEVLYKKECKGSVYLVCDGGSSQHASSAFLGRHIRNNFPMHILGKDSSPETDPETVNVVGPLCTPTDVIGQKVTLAKAVPGDILVVEKSGAYGLTNSPYAFLSHPRPAEALYLGGKVHILRERGQAEDFLKGQQGLNE